MDSEMPVFDQEGLTNFFTAGTKELQEKLANRIRSDSVCSSRPQSSRMEKHKISNKSMYLKI